MNLLRIRDNIFNTDQIVCISYLYDRKLLRIQTVKEMFEFECFSDNEWLEIKKRLGSEDVKNG